MTHIVDRPDHDTGPRQNNDLHVETRGLDPVPPSARYGDRTRLLSIFFMPNLTASMFFAGTLATASFIGLNFAWAMVAIVAGNLVACLPVGILGIIGARTGMAQLPLARLPFGRSVILPALLNWGTNILWDGLNCLFGAEALHVLLGTPFWGGLLIVIAAQTALSFVGYEAIHLFGKVASVLVSAIFIAITVKCISVGSISFHAQTHGGASVGGFILMVSIVMSYTFTWAPYASDYTRYLPSDTPGSAIVWRMVAGNAFSAIWLETIGLIASKSLTDQTSAGIYNFLGKGAFGAFAMIAVVLSNVGADAMDDYSGALSLQAAGVRIARPLSAALVAAGGFGVALWMDHGNFQTRLTNLLLFLGYWIGPFAGIVLADWWARKGRVHPAQLVSLRYLPTGWQAVVSILVGFGVSVPFMDSSLYVGPIASGPLHGGDIAYIVGFFVAGLVYLGLARATGVFAAHDAAGRQATNITLLDEPAPTASVVV
jgi:NCS1 family nucleobase:cation symporter-1